MRLAVTFAAAAMIALGSAGCAASQLARAQAPDQDRTARDESTDCLRSIGIDGLEAPLSIGELTRRSDLVIVGTVIADRIERLTSVPGVPLEERDPLIFAFGSYHDATLEVTEYLKGNGPSRISVRRLASTRELCVSHGQPELALGTQYVLFLERGRGVWIGGYVVIGRRGTAVVANASRVLTRSVTSLPSCCAWACRSPRSGGRPATENTEGRPTVHSANSRRWVASSTEATRRESPTTTLVTRPWGPARQCVPATSE